MFTSNGAYALKGGSLLHLTLGYYHYYFVSKIWGKPVGLHRMRGGRLKRVRDIPRKRKGEKGLILGHMSLLLGKAANMKGERTPLMGRIIIGLWLYWI